jgi:hypothetical protein
MYPTDALRKLRRASLLGQCHLEEAGMSKRLEALQPQQRVLSRGCGREMRQLA